MAEHTNTDARPNAWLLDFGNALRAAVGMRVLMQIIDSPKLHLVPFAPPHCQHVLAWQGQLLPVVDMAVLLGYDPQAPRLLAITGHQEHAGDPTQFSALLLSAPPVAIIVGNDQVCSLPVQPEGWEKYALSCFGHRGEEIPVLHLGRIFARPGNGK
jgi:hypothetical protein